MTRIVLAQPSYFPWAGFLAQLAVTDILVWLDDVAASDQSVINRTRLKFQSGPQWMTVPIAPDDLGQRLCDIQPADAIWRARHLAMLVQALSHHPFAGSAISLFEQVSRAETIAELFSRSVESMAEYFGVLPTTVRRASTMNISGNGRERIIRIAQELGASEVLAGTQHISGTDKAEYHRAGLKLQGVETHLVDWAQIDGVFDIHVSGLDLVAACGPAGAARLVARRIESRLSVVGSAEK